MSSTLELNVEVETVLEARDICAGEKRLSSSELGSKRLEWRLPGVGVEKSSEAFSILVKDVAEWVLAASNEYFLGNIVFFARGGL